MSVFPKTPSKIRERIARYERELRREYKLFNAIDDSYGKRYLLGPLYLLLNDTQGAVKLFAWFARMFPDDMGPAEHFLSWALTLYRAGKLDGATQKLGNAMLANLYVIPHLLGIRQPRLRIWYGSNWAEKDYLKYVPPEIWTLWDEPAKQWANEVYQSAEFRRIRARYIQIGRELLKVPVGSRRHQLVTEVFELREMKADTP